MFYFSLDFSSLIDEIPMSGETILRRGENKVKQYSSGKEHLDSHCEAAASHSFVTGHSSHNHIYYLVFVF